jgi:Zn-dependent alcohol dehydrogenase
MSDEMDKTETSRCGECDSCLAGYEVEYCTTQNTGKTSTIPSVHNNGNEPLEY